MIMLYICFVYRYYKNHVKQNIDIIITNKIEDELLDVIEKVDSVKKFWLEYEH